MFPKPIEEIRLLKELRSSSLEISLPVDSIVTGKMRFCA